MRKISLKIRRNFYQPSWRYKRFHFPTYTVPAWLHWALATSPLCQFLLVFLLRMGQPQALFQLFLVFSIKQYNFTTNQCEKCPYSIRHRDLNSQSSEYESLPLTNRPELPPTILASLPLTGHQRSNIQSNWSLIGATTSWLYQQMP